MRLPGGHQVRIEERKVRDYLLSATHPVGRFKARVFASAGVRWPITTSWPCVPHRSTGRRTTRCSGPSRRKRWCFAADLGVRRTNGRGLEHVTTSRLDRIGDSANPIGSPVRADADAQKGRTRTPRVVLQRRLDFHGEHAGCRVRPRSAKQQDH